MKVRVVTKLSETDKDVELDLGEGSSLGNLLDLLELNSADDEKCVAYGLTSQPKGIVVLVNNRIRERSWKLDPGDKIIVLPLIPGG